MKNSCATSYLLTAQPIVEVFKTTVQNDRQARPILINLKEHFPDYEINFDLEDCDRILRVAGDSVDVAMIMAIMASFGHSCFMLD